jgi:DNA-binding NtrC family response regulator
MAVRHTVLVVAPEGEARGEILRNLRSTGCLVSVAGRADAALELLSGLRFELVACSPLLPDGSGAEFLADVRRRYPASALLLIGAGTPAADLDFDLLLRVSKLARRSHGRHGGPSGEAS